MPWELLSNFTKTFPLKSSNTPSLVFWWQEAEPKTGILWYEFYSSHTSNKMEWTQAKLRTNKTSIRQLIIDGFHHKVSRRKHYHTMTRTVPNVIACATDTTSWHARGVWLTINCPNTLPCTMCTLTLGIINAAIFPECLMLMRVAFFFTKLRFNSSCTSLRECVTDSTGCTMYLQYIYICVCVCVCVW